MSKETLQYLNTNTLIGHTSQRGTAWHYRAEHQGDEQNHYAGAIPVDDVQRRLFDWEAESRPLAVEQPSFADGYQRHQYSEWLLTSVANILDDGLSISSAGLLKEGAIAWVEVSMPDTISTPEGVDFRPNLLATTSFDGSIATTFKRTVTATVCDNTRELALSERGQEYKVRHSRYSNLRLSEARGALSIVHQMGAEFTAEVQALCQLEVEGRVWSAFLDAHVPLVDERTNLPLEGRSKSMAQNKRDALNQLYRHDRRAEPWSGTAYGVVQAVNTYEHHEAIVRGATRAERNMLRAVTGDFGKVDRSAWSTLQKVLAAA